MKLQGLYAILDLSTLDRLGGDPVVFTDAVIRGGVAALQLRAKEADARRVLALLAELLPRARAAEIPLLVNDRLDVALLSGVDGLHVGQADVTPVEVRQLAAGIQLSVGWSTHDRAQALLGAAMSEIDYLALGPVASTITKLRADPSLGIERARSIAADVKALRPELPLCAIGGVDERLARDLSGAFDLVAVVSSLLSAGVGADAIYGRTRDLRQAFEAKA